VSPIQLLLDSLANLSAKLPMWARLLLGFWILIAGIIALGWLDLPVENPWLLAIILAPAGLFVVALILQMVANLVTWGTWPFRKVAEMLRKPH
jgi:hypothetical protein